MPDFLSHLRPSNRSQSGPLKDAIYAALTLVLVPPLRQVRERVMFEFPHAIDAIDFARADLIGRTIIRLRPSLLVGDPRGGKFRFARPLGEVLGLNIWPTDASRSDSAVFAGTDRRWYSAAPLFSDRPSQARQSHGASEQDRESRHPLRLWPAAGLRSRTP
jgi:ATP-dependent Lon protease